VYSTGLEVKYGITNLQRERGSNGVWILQRIKLLEHAMKVVERILEYRIRQQIDTDDMQFGFMKGKGTTNAILLFKIAQSIACAGYLLQNGTTYDGEIWHADAWQHDTGHGLGLWLIGVVIGKKMKLF